MLSLLLFPIFILDCHFIQMILSLVLMPFRLAFMCYDNHVLLLMLIGLSYTGNDSNVTDESI